MTQCNYAKLLLSAVIGIAPLAGLATLGGCEGETVGVGVSSYDDGTVYEPGYYYDEAYFDVDHHWHPRRYYYYDGHSFADRNEVPHGYVARERREVHQENQRNQRDRDQDHDRH